MSTLIGDTVSHYQILDRLGGGGMGVVYKALDLKLGRLVALKFLASQRGASEEQKRRFLREAKAASVLDHPNVCTLYEVGEEDGAPFLVMAFCEGETVHDRLRGGPLPVEDAVAVALQVAAGLAAAHERGIVHRDVKPANVIVGAGGQVKLVDFGVAKLTDQSQLTRTGSVVGTPVYMSPEQFLGAPAGPGADIWALGCLLYEMLTGRAPFEERGEKETVRAILERDPKPLKDLQPAVPPALDWIVTRLLAKRPSIRYAAMEDVLADLRALGHEPKPSSGEATLLEIPLSASRPAEPASRGGTTVGPYELLELLGAGGMGIVHRARDTRLERVVALKLLPPELTRDPEMKRRFLQEARAASALDHPNLCTILEVGETDDGGLYLSMPCYDGETLRQKLEHGALGLDEALEIGEQIARGLAKAHRGGIVHRDIKPANLIVTGDGVVKILDFGLAKLAGEAAVTRTGSSAGTPAYMSPEQAGGEAVDHRTDLWSLGVVLYEMVTGQRPFRGEREPSLLYAILNERPRPLRELRPAAPPELESIVERLLDKDPGRRYESADEVFAELRLLRGLTVSGSTVIRPAPAKRSSWPWTAAALAVALTLAGLLILQSFGQSKASPLQATFTRLTSQDGREVFPSLSPDGDYFVYARETAPGNLDLYLQRIGGSNALNLTADSPVDDTQPAYSPDGKLIAFRSEREGGGIFLMEATGEAVRRLTESGYNPAWSPDGKEVLFATRKVEDPQAREGRSQIAAVTVATGRRRLVIESDAVQPSWSPDGRRIAYWGLSPNSAKRVLYTSLADGRDQVPVVDDQHLNWNPVWSADGRHLFFSSDRSGSLNLWRLPIDEETGEARGEPEPVTTPSPWSGMLSLSRDGRQMLFATRERRSNLVRTAFDPVSGRASGPLVSVTQGAQRFAFGRVSPDGQWIVFASLESQEDLFVVRPDGSELRQITKDPFKDRLPNWSPDGTIIFFSNRKGSYGVWSIRPDGSALRPVTPPGESVHTAVVSPDGHWLACIAEWGGAALIDLTKPLAQRIPEPMPDLGTPGAIFIPGSWTPDSRWLAGTWKGGILLYSLASRKYLPLTDRGVSPVWMRDSRRLLYSDGGSIFVVDRVTGRSHPALASAGVGDLKAPGLSPDERSLFVTRAAEEGDVWLLTLRGGEP